MKKKLISLIAALSLLCTFSALSACGGNSGSAPSGGGGQQSGVEEEPLHSVDVSKLADFEYTVHSDECTITGLKDKSRTSVFIPNGVKAIGSHAFEDCTSLTRVALPDSLTGIGISAFANCENLESVSISDSSKLESIGNGAFANCENLESIKIPDGVVKISSNAFSGCRALESVSIGKGVTEIETYAFYNCTAILSLKVNDLSAWCKIAFSLEDSNPLRYAKNLYIGNDKSPVKNLVIPDGVEKISAYSFISAFEFSNHGKDFFEEGENGEEAGYKKELISVTLPEGVTEIGGFAFRDCERISSVNLPESLTAIGNRTFSNCPWLESINYAGTKAGWEEIEKGDSWDYSSGSYTVHCSDGNLYK